MNDGVLPSPDQLTPPVQWEVEWPVPGWDNLGLTTDDHCLLLFIRDEWGYWEPTKHWPLDAVRAAQDYLAFGP